MSPGWLAFAEDRVTWIQDQFAWARLAVEKSKPLLAPNPTATMESKRLMRESGKMTQVAVVAAISAECAELLGLNLVFNISLTYYSNHALKTHAHK